MFCLFKLSSVASFLGLLQPSVLVSFGLQPFLLGVRVSLSFSSAPFLALCSLCSFLRLVCVGWCFGSSSLPSSCFGCFSVLECLAFTPCFPFSLLFSLFLWPLASAFLSPASQLGAGVKVGGAAACSALCCVWFSAVSSRSFCDPREFGALWVACVVAFPLSLLTSCKISVSKARGRKRRGPKTPANAHEAKERAQGTQS